MRDTRLTAIVLGLGAGLLLGCAEGTAPAPPRPAFSVTNGPAFPGPIVVRFQDRFVYIGTDPARGLLSVHNLGAVDPSESVRCGGDEAFDVLDLQVVFTSPDVARFLIQGNDETVQVYDLAAWFSVTGFCNRLLLPPLAQGRAVFRYLDNNFFVGGNGQEVFGFQSEGTLDDVASGGRVHYNEEQKMVLLPDGTFKVVAENIDLRPIGND